MGGGEVFLIVPALNVFLILSIMPMILYSGYSNTEKELQLRDIAHILACKRSQIPSLALPFKGFQVLDGERSSPRTLESCYQSE